MRELYTDRVLITARGLDYTNGNRISSFGPLDEQGLLDTRAWLGLDAVAIAMTDFGDAIYLRPGSAQGETVYITHHDGGDTEVFAESMAAMVNTLRDANHHR